MSSPEGQAQEGGLLDSSSCPLCVPCPLPTPQESKEAYREAGPRRGLTLLLPPANARRREHSARQNREHRHHDNQSPASGQVWGPGLGIQGSGSGSTRGWVPCPLEFGVSAADWPSSKVAVSQVCPGGRGGHECLSWGVCGEGQDGWVVAAPPWTLSVSTVALPPASSFQLLLPSLWGNIWRHPSFQSTSGRTALFLRPGLEPLPQMTLAHPGP